jgi:hypothetical protein
LYVGIGNLFCFGNFYMRVLSLLVLWSLLVLFVSCETNGAAVDGESGEEGQGKEEELHPPDQPCGNPVLVDVRDMDGKSTGVLETLNDDQRLWLVYSPNLSNRLIGASLYVGDEKKIPRDGLGHDLISEFPLVIKNDPDRIGWTYSVLLDSLPECVAIVAYLHLADRETSRPLPNQLRYAWSQGNRQEQGRHTIFFCPESCDPFADRCPAGLEPGQFRTFSSASWDADLNGPTGGAYLEQTFPVAFPEGLVIGCDKRVVLQDAAAVRAFLPSRGPGSELTSSLTNPGNIGNGLAGEICALVLSIGLDEADESFGQSPTLLGTLYIASGPFAGWKVSDLLNEANAVLGGCASNYSAGQMEEVIRSVNENFDQGQVNKGFLKCNID